MKTPLLLAALLAASPALAQETWIYSSRLGWYSIPDFNLATAPLTQMAAAKPPAPAGTPVTNRIEVLEITKPCGAPGCPGQMVATNAFARMVVIQKLDRTLFVPAPTDGDGLTARLIRAAGFPHSCSLCTNVAWYPVSYPLMVTNRVEVAR